MITRTDVTYGQLDKVLRSLGFLTRLDLVMVRTMLNEFGIADPTAFAGQGDCAIMGNLAYLRRDDFSPGAVKQCGA